MSVFSCVGCSSCCVIDTAWDHPPINCLYGVNPLMEWTKETKKRTGLDGEGDD